MIWKSFCFALFALSLVSPAAAEGLLVWGETQDYGVVLNTSDDWVVLNTAFIIIEHGSDPREYGCVATASADVKNPGPVFRENQYRFVLARDGYFPTVDSSDERTLELVDNAMVGTSGSQQQFIDVDDPDSESVMVTSFFTGVDATNGTGPPTKHYFHFLGRKVQQGDTNASVLDSSLSVICVPVTDKPTRF